MKMNLLIDVELSCQCHASALLLNAVSVSVWLGGWVIGKSDFNESPVVSPDLDLDFGLRLRVCQYCKSKEIFSSQLNS